MSQKAELDIAYPYRHQLIICLSAGQHKISCTLKNLRWNFYPLINGL